MRLTAALSIAFVLGTTFPALADDVYLPKEVPQCTKFVVPSVGTVCGYVDVEDWKKVLAVDAELVHLRERVKKEGERADNLALQVSLLQDQVATYAKSQVLLVDRTDKLTKDLIALDKKYQDERVKPTWGSPLAWTVAAVSTSILAGLVLAAVID